jgi:predicted ATPase
MYISKFRVRNHKSYRDSDEVEFKPGFNVITGQNNAGKTAFLEAMTLQFAASPHRSIRTIPAPGSLPEAMSSIRVTFSITNDELRDFVGLQSHFVPQPEQGFPIPGNGPYRRQQNEATALLRWLFDTQSLSISFLFSRNASGGESWNAEGPVLGLYDPGRPEADGSIIMLNFRLGLDRQLNFDGFGRSNNAANYVSTDIAPLLRNRIYRFSAERFSMGRWQFGNHAVLAPNAQNLPEVLNILQANPARFSQLNKNVNQILPQVRQISVRPVVNANQQLEIIVWPHDPASQREDLAIPLNDCGSGVGQVLAMLYVVMTSDHPHIILVDEPQSFLHPGAVRKLIEVLKRYPKHQYILSTHSPTVISAAEPAKIFIAKATDGETSLKVVDPRSTEDLRSYLLEIGARLSDVFGADSILWVEGQTEETCFPEILKVVARHSLMASSVVGIRQTGDITGRDKKKILEIYRRLSETNSLLPPALAFVLDRECLNDSQRDDLRRISRDLVHFLPRRTYENYLLDARAISTVANEIQDFRPGRVEAHDVQELIDQKSRDLRYFCPGLDQIPAEWLIHINGAQVLGDIFGELSENRVVFNKMTHSVAITHWLLRNSPDSFRDLSDWLVGLLPS